jgi:glycosyl transferase family 87
MKIAAGDEGEGTIEGQGERHRGTRRLISGSGLAATLRRPEMVVIVWLAAILHTAILFASLRGRVNRFDFSVHYSSALALRQNLDPYMIDLRRIGVPLGLEIWPLIHSSATPFFLLCFEPLAHMAPRTAYWIWFGLNVAALVTALLLILGRREFGTDRRMAWVIAAFALMYPPLADHFAYAQAQIVMLLMLILMMRCLETRRDGVAGLILAMAAALRVFPSLFVIYFAVLRRWRALMYTLLGLVIIGIVTVFLTGPAIVEGFVAATISRAGENATSRPYDVSLSAFITRLFWYTFGYTLSPAVNLVRLAVVGCAEAAVLILALRATTRAHFNQDRDGRAYMIWVVTAVVLSPVAWIHYMVLLVLPFIKVASVANQGRCSSRAVRAMVSSYFLIALSIEGRAPAEAIGGFPLLVIVSEGASVSLLLAFIAAYWFASDETQTIVSRELPGSHARFS